jgi:sugar phosphate isomerase/epimerase
MYQGLSVSNIAWPSDAFDRAIELATGLQLDGIELAPHQLFRTWDVADDDVRQVRRRLEGAGLSCPALQGILYDVPEATLFGGPDSRKVLARHLARIAHMAGLLGAKACVFGAPKQRDPGELSGAEAHAIALDFFRTIAPVFAENDTALAIEANSRAYECRFLTTTAEAVAFVAAADRPGLAVQIDMGTIFLEGEDPNVLSDAAPLAAHAHVSEPQLREIGSSETDHGPTAAALRASGYAGYLSIEMRASEHWEAALTRAVGHVRKVYL